MKHEETICAQSAEEAELYENILVANGVHYTCTGYDRDHYIFVLTSHSKTFNELLDEWLENEELRISL